MPRPGIMLYFDILRPIRSLSDEEKGRLFIAILEYGQDGIVPEFDGMLAMAWEFIRPRLDRDGESYEAATAQKQYATFCRECKRNDVEKISFDEWLLLSDDQRKQVRSGDIGRYPSTSTPPTTSAITSTAPTISTTTNTAGKREGAGEGKPDLEDFNTKRNRAIAALSDYRV